MVDAIEILELKIGIVFYGYLEKTHFQELNKRIKNVKKEYKLQFVINFLENKNHKIKTISSTRLDMFPALIGHFI